MINHEYPDIIIEISEIKKAALYLRAINHRLRQQILALLSEKGKMTVTEIYIHMQMEQPVTSQQLGILRKAGCVTTTRDKKYIYYSVNFEGISLLGKAAEKLVAGSCCI